jgi:hypothetical protein
VIAAASDIGFSLGIKSLFGNRHLGHLLTIAGTKKAKNDKNRYPHAGEVSNLRRTNQVISEMGQTSGFKAKPKHHSPAFASTQLGTQIASYPGMATQNRNGHIFYYVEKGDTLWGITQKLFKHLSASEIQKKIAEVQKINPHIKNPNLIHPKSVIHFGPVNGFSSQPAYAADLTEMEKTLDACSIHERDYLFKHYETIDAIWAVSQKNTLTMPVPSTVVDNIKSGFRVVKAARNTLDVANKGIYRWKPLDPFVWREVEGKVVQGLKSEIRAVQQANGAIGLIPKEARAFQQGGKVLIVNFNSGEGMKTFSSAVKARKDIASKIIKPLGKAFKIADAGFALYNIHDKWGTPEQNVTIFKETGKFGMGLVNSTVSTGLASGVCGFLTLTTGVGGAACFLTVFVASSYGASKLGEWGGEKIYEFGKSRMEQLDVLYETQHPIYIQY